VHVVTSRQRYNDPGAVLPALETFNGVHIHRVWTSCFGRGWLPGRALDYGSFYLSAGWQLWRLARQGDIIVAKTDPPLISLVAAAMVRWRGARLVNWLQDLFPEVATTLGVKGLQGRPARLLQRWRNASLRRAAINVVRGERMAEYVQGQGIAPEHIAVIPNWAEGDAIQPLSPRTIPCVPRGGLEDQFVVGYSGNMGRVHEFETILGAMALLQEGLPPHPSPLPMRGEGIQIPTPVSLGGEGKRDYSRTVAGMGGAGECHTLGNRESHYL
jgi:colanic acid biosynthesis glycosyl transferase WcaI